MADIGTSAFVLRQTGKEGLLITRAQWESIKRKYSQSPSDAETFQVFCDRVQSCGDYIMMPWCGMWLGIEADGYTHS